MGCWVLTVDTNIYWWYFLTHFLPHCLFTFPFETASCYIYRVPVRNTSNVPLKLFVRHLYVTACLLQTSRYKISKTSHNSSHF